MSNLTAEEAQELYRNSIVIDAMAGTTYAFEDIGRAGITGAHVTLAAHNETAEKMLDRLKEYYAGLLVYPDSLCLVEKSTDIERAKAERKTGLILGLQTITPMEQDWTNLWLFRKLGIRIAQLTYMNHTLAGDGCMEEPDRGLTYFGERTVLVMNQVGILVDLAHCGWTTAEGVLKVTKDPIVTTHSNPYQKCPVRRNLPDAILKGIAESGGVIGINGHPAICTTRTDGSRPTLDDFLACLDYTVKLVGIDHVGLGPDLFHNFTPREEVRWHVGGYMLPGAWKTTQGLEDEFDIPSIAPALAKRGYSASDIQKILGLNFLRVFKAVWDKANL
jgi:membrane dipeptidase